MIDKYIGILVLILFYGLYDRFKSIEKRKGLVVGYKYLPCFKVYLDSQKYYHAIVTGVTNCGKSMLVEKMVQGQNVVLINTWESDFKSLPGAKRINDKQSILSFLNGLQDNKEEIYIVIDEMATLYQDKEIGKAINCLLQYGRHYQVHIIGISPRILANEVSCKSLFPCRITGRLMQDSDYKTALGISINATLGLHEFIMITDKVEVFKSYEIKTNNTSNQKK